MPIAQIDVVDVQIVGVLKAGDGDHAEAVAIRFRECRALRQCVDLFAQGGVFGRELLDHLVSVVDLAAPTKFCTEPWRTRSISIALERICCDCEKKRRTTACTSIKVASSVRQ